MNLNSRLSVDATVAGLGDVIDQSNVWRLDLVKLLSESTKQMDQWRDLLNKCAGLFSANCETAQPQVAKLVECVDFAVHQSTVWERVMAEALSEARKTRGAAVIATGDISRSADKLSSAIQSGAAATSQILALAQGSQPVAVSAIDTLWESVRVIDSSSSLLAKALKLIAVQSLSQISEVSGAIQAESRLWRGEASRCISIAERLVDLVERMEGRAVRFLNQGSLWLPICLWTITLLAASIFSVHVLYYAFFFFVGTLRAWSSGTILWHLVGGISFLIHVSLWHSVIWKGAKRTPSSSNATTTLPPDIQSPLSAQATSNNNGSEEPRCSVLDICSVTTQDPAKCVEEIASMTTAPHNSQHNSLESSQIATLADSPCVLPSHRRIFSTVIRMRTVTDADGL